MGTYSEMTGAKALGDCKLAPAGNYAEGTGNDGFTPCLAGTYQDKPGQGACKVSGSWKVWGVDSGRRGGMRPRIEPLQPRSSSAARPACPACSPALLPPSLTQACPPGFACPAGSVNPKPCAAGFFADMKQPFCRECPKGQYQDQTKQRACKPCPAGAYCPNTKTTSPVKCPAGTFNKNLGTSTATSCAKCPINVSSSCVWGASLCVCGVPCCLCCCYCALAHPTPCCSPPQHLLPQCLTISLPPHHLPPAVRQQPGGPADLQAVHHRHLDRPPHRPDQVLVDQPGAAQPARRHPPPLSGRQRQLAAARIRCSCFSLAQPARLPSSDPPLEALCHGLAFACFTLLQPSLSRPLNPTTTRASTTAALPAALLFWCQFS